MFVKIFQPRYKSDELTDRPAKQNKTLLNLKRWCVGRRTTWCRWFKCALKLKQKTQKHGADENIPTMWSHGVMFLKKKHDTNGIFPLYSSSSGVKLASLLFNGTWLNRSCTDEPIHNICRVPKMLSHIWIESLLMVAPALFLWCVEAPKPSLRTTTQAFRDLAVCSFPPFPAYLWNAALSYFSIAQFSPYK